MSAHSVPPLSIVVNNWNYERYVGLAIDSALTQTLEGVEVIVVDDGSSDNSRSVIESFGDRVQAVFKDNGGQGSAFNAGHRVATSPIVIFLDADDVLFPKAGERIVGAWNPGLSKIHWPMTRIDAEGNPLGGLVPYDPLPAGDMRSLTFEHGPSSSASSPTSGNAWSRAFLDRVMPVPENTHRIGADAFLFGLAPALGQILRISEPLGSYRLHRSNYRGTDFDSRLSAGIASIQEQWRLLLAISAETGHTPDVEQWERESYFHRLSRGLDEIERQTQPGDSVILLDEARWGIGRIVRGREFLPFPELNGSYGGLPADEQQAVGELERMTVRSQARFIAVAWQGYWWLDHYRLFTEWLKSNARLLHSGPDVIIFNIPTH